MSTLLILSFGGVSWQSKGAKHGGTGLVLWFADTLNGGYCAVGTGLWSTLVDTIFLDSLPAGATVRKAFLVWTVVDSSPYPAMNFNGNALSPTLAGVGPTPCRLYYGDSTYTYVADVTPYVSGNGAYELSGYNATSTEGASLVVIYELNSEPVRNVVFYAGGYTIEGGLYYEFRWDIKEFLAANPVGSAKITYIFYDGQEIPEGYQCGREYIYYDTAALDSGFTTIAGHQGAYWDNLTFDVTALTFPNWDSVQVGYATAPDQDDQGCTDCIGVAACVFQVNYAEPQGAAEAPLTGPRLLGGLGWVKLTAPTKGRLLLYSADGKLVRVLASGEIAKGRYSLGALPKGVYFIELVRGNRKDVIRTLVR